jgi:hypothetical protein
LKINGLRDFSPVQRACETVQTVQKKACSPTKANIFHVHVSRRAYRMNRAPIQRTTTESQTNRAAARGHHLREHGRQIGAAAARHPGRGERLDIDGSSRRQGEPTMKTNILECPHCGGAAYLNSNYSYKIRAYFVFVKCEVCGATGKVTRSDNDPAEDDWQSPPCESAIAAWNLRTSPKARKGKRGESEQK